jgi:hypothetical protein
MTDLAKAIPGLMAFRQKVGADTPKGYRTTSVIEGIQNLPQWEPMPWFCDPRQTPQYWIKKYLSGLGG